MSEDESKASSDSKGSGETLGSDSAWSTDDDEYESDFVCDSPVRPALRKVQKRRMVIVLSDSE